jgi:hypothetical protein
MGHTEKTHLTKYRTHDAALHAGRMGKVLMAIDEGTIQQYVGKSIDELDENVVMDQHPTSTELDTEPTNISSDTLPNPEESIRPQIIGHKRKLFESDEEGEEETDHRGNTPGRRRSYSKRRPHKKKRMSIGLKEALKTELADNIKCPSTERVLQAIAALEEEFPEIVEHSPKKIKALISNWNRKKNN